MDHHLESIDELRVMVRRDFLLIETFPSVGSKGDNKTQGNLQGLGGFRNSQDSQGSFPRLQKQ